MSLILPRHGTQGVLQRTFLPELGGFKDHQRCVHSSYRDKPWEGVFLELTPGFAMMVLLLIQVMSKSCE